MEVKQNKAGEKLSVSIKGRIDTNSAPELQSLLFGSIFGMKEVDFDMREVEYISSAGLRVLLALQKQCLRLNAKLSIHNCNDMIVDVFKMTGFDKILNVI